jgi:hypothetical protein
LVQELFTRVEQFAALQEELPHVDVRVQWDAPANEHARRSTLAGIAAMYRLDEIAGEKVDQYSDTPEGTMHFALNLLDVHGHNVWVQHGLDLSEKRAYPGPAKYLIYIWVRERGALSPAAEAGRRKSA